MRVLFHLSAVMLGVAFLSYPSVVVQGQARRLQEIADSMLTRRGVIGGTLQLHAAVIPPIQVPVKKMR